MQRQRAAFREAMPAFDPKALVVVDESGSNQAMARDDGRAPRGQRALGAKPGQRGPQVTMVGAWCLVGVVAAMMVEGFGEGAAFLVFVPEGLVPQLRPGHVVGLDHLKVHKAAGVREAIEAMGARLIYLPPTRQTAPPLGMLVQNQDDLANEGGTDTGAPLAGHHGGVCGDHKPGCSGLVYTCRLSCSIQLKSAARQQGVNHAAAPPDPDPLFEDLWQDLPPETIAMARAFKALVRAKKVKTPPQLLRVVFLSCGFGKSRRAAAADFTRLHESITGSSIAERLAACRPWVQAVLAEMLPTHALTTLPTPWHCLVIDASSIQGPGAQGTQYRLPSGLDLGPLQLVSITVTEQQRGASLAPVLWGPGEIALADRGYA